MLLFVALFIFVFQGSPEKERGEKKEIKLIESAQYEHRYTAHFI